jgi:hypothetical protein
MASQNDPDMLDEYDFSGGVGGKYAKLCREGTHLIRLDDDVAVMLDPPCSSNLLMPVCQAGRPGGCWM